MSNEINEKAISVIFDLNTDIKNYVKHINAINENNRVLQEENKKLQNEINTLKAKNVYLEKETIDCKSLVDNLESKNEKLLTRLKSLNKANGSRGKNEKNPVKKC